MEWGEDVILWGDFNVTLSATDRFKRGTIPGEEQLAKIISDYVNDIDLTDAWNNKTGFTWRRGQTMSRLDWVLYNINRYSLATLEVNWTVTQSDHTAVVLTLQHTQKQRFIMNTLS
jgi:hypothetical protein